MTPKLHRLVLRFCLVLLLLLIGNLIRTVWQQQASINLAIAKGQQLYLSADGQLLGLNAAELANLNTADSNLVFVDALPMTPTESRPWADWGCTTNSCAHLTYYNRATGGTVNQILLLHDNSVVAQWQDDLARPAGSSFIANEAIKIAADDPAVTAVLGNIGAGDPAMIPMSAWLADDACRDEWCVDLTFHNPTGDGRIFHVFVNMTQQAVARTFYTRARPDLDVAAPVSQRDAFTDGCHEQDGWSVCWEMTAHDGVLFRDATYEEKEIFSSVKITQVEAWYPSWPGGYRDEIGFSATVPPFGDTIVNELEDGFEVRQLFTEFTRWPNCICCYRYEEIMRFFADGSFEPRFVSYGPGCDDLSIYRPFWRLDIDLDGPEGDQVWLWQETEWVEAATELELFPFIDNLDPDGFKLATGNGDLLYRWTMLPTDPLGLDEALFFVLKDNELEGEQPLSPGPGDTFQPPRQWLDDEPISGEDIVLWFVPLLKTKKTEPLWCMPDPEPGINQCEAILRAQITDELPHPTAEQLAALVTATPVAAGTAAPPAPTPTPRPVEGDTVEEVILNAGCGACHAIGPLGEGHKVGPDLSAIGYEATGRIPDIAAADYIRQSIVEPNYALAPVCPNGPCMPNIMPQDYGLRLTETQIDEIVDYLLMLDGTQERVELPVVGDGDTDSFPKGGTAAKGGDGVINRIEPLSTTVQLVVIGVVLLVTLFLLWKRPYDDDKTSDTVSRRES